MPPWSSWWKLTCKRFIATRMVCQPTQELEQLYHLATTINETSSTLAKKERLLENPTCHDLLRRIYDPHLRHYVTSKSVLAHAAQCSNGTPPYQSLTELLDALSSRRITGKAALHAAASFYNTYCQTDGQKQIFCRVLDRNLKMGMSVLTIQSLLQKQNEPLFKGVALANTTPWKPGGEWYASRKLDGVRCITFVSDESITFYSRTGKAFTSLQKVEQSIRERFKGDPFVLDGEICVYNDGMEDFLQALGQIRTQQQPMPNPVYEVFDLVSMQGFRQGKDPMCFAERQKQLAEFIKDPQAHLRMVEQIRIDTQKQLSGMKDEAIQKGWEGLILRKNVAYEGKRSRNMLKIKEWEDAEYTVKSIETGRMRLPDTGQDTEVMTNVVIEHKGNLVSVGSGFTMQQRKRYFEKPDLIVGKPITVRYFSESIGESGQPSLRFPSVKAIYEEGKRTV
ncbi:hypothetical protein BJV82DRAFT_646320 [Fennellomyces sp. T-0311]|nr:hypothetical protein BJV82DRAFT_646320 [Fennellomyces sp. T-0311]